MRLSNIICALLLLLSVNLIVRAENLNEQEVERVQEAQEIDRRASVFLHIAERRLNVILGISDAAAKEQEKKEKKKDKKKDKDDDQTSSNDYGPEPKGTTEQLIRNYYGVIQELMDKLDDAYEKQRNKESLSKAIKRLVEGGEKQLKLLEQVRSKIRSPEEERALAKAWEIVKMAVDGARGFKTD